MSLLSVTTGVSGTPVVKSAQTQQDLDHLASVTNDSGVLEWVTEAKTALLDDKPLPDASASVKQEVFDIDGHIATRLFGQPASKTGFFDQPHPRYSDWLPQEKFDLLELVRKLKQAGRENALITVGVDRAIAMADLRETGEYPLVSDIPAIVMELEPLVSARTLLVGFLKDAGRSGLAGRVEAILEQLYHLHEELVALNDLADELDEEEWDDQYHNACWLEYTPR